MFQELCNTFHNKFVDLYNVIVVNASFSDKIQIGESYYFITVDASVNKPRSNRMLNLIMEMFSKTIKPVFEPGGMNRTGILFFNYHSLCIRNGAVAGRRKI